MHCSIVTLRRHVHINITIYQWIPLWIRASLMRKWCAIFIRLGGLSGLYEYCPVYAFSWLVAGAYLIDRLRANSLEQRKVITKHKGRLLCQNSMCTMTGWPPQPPTIYRLGGLSGLSGLSG
jgi:hypothetical protein